MCVMMSILAFLFSRGRWHISQFFTLITRSKVSPESEPEPDKSSSEEPEDWWVEPDNGNVFVHYRRHRRDCQLYLVMYAVCGDSTLCTPSSGDTSRSSNKYISWRTRKVQFPKLQRTLRRQGTNSCPRPNLPAQINERPFLRSSPLLLIRWPSDLHLETLDGLVDGDLVLDWFHRT